MSRSRWLKVVAPALCVLWLQATSPGESNSAKTYRNQLTPIAEPRPIMADFPEFYEPVREVGRFESPMLIDDPAGDLEVRAWRFSYNARGIVEVPNRLKASQTAIVIVHPWGIDDGQGWTTPEPAGVAFACTPEKNRLCLKHAEKAVNPFLKSLRGKVGVIAYSLPGKEDPVRKKIYRSIRTQPSAAERKQGVQELTGVLRTFPYEGQPLPSELKLSSDRPAAADYFSQFPGLDAGAKFNHAGFWELPIPVCKPIEVAAEDVVIYDPEGYEPMRRFLQEQGIRHVLLGGYHTDMCVCDTTAGYKNLSKDFNVFLVGDATLATFPAIASPKIATTATLAKASLTNFITQISWIQPTAR